MKMKYKMLFNFNFNFNPTMNINPETGIHYGIISANSLDQGVVHDLLYGEQARNHTEEEMIREKRFEELDYIEEPEISGVYEDIEYATCWLGGALNFFITYSPFTVGANLCSPCVPNAGNLDDLEEGTNETYDVPEDWRSDEN